MLAVRRKPFCVCFHRLYSLRRNIMKAFLLACVAAIVVAALAAGALTRVQEPVQEPVQEAFATSAVRL
jgi:hypothetical protein